MSEFSRSIGIWVGVVPHTRAWYATVGIPARELLASEGDTLHSYHELPSWQEWERVGTAGRGSLTLSSMPDGTAYLKVESAVVTVPAYFNDAQRTATKTAGESPD